MIKVVVLGVAGRMGKRVVACASNYPEVEIIGGIEQAGNDAVGSDLGEIAGVGKSGAIVSDSLADALAEADVCIDFTHHSSIISNLSTIAAGKTPCVICTTGFNDEELEKIDDTAKKVPILLSPNMSVGVNLLFDLVGEVASKLGEDYNIEIGAGLGEFAGKAWRIGLMGCSCTENHVNMLLSALQKIKRG